MIVSDYPTATNLVTGAVKKMQWTVTSGTVSTKCTLSFALARPWEWQGFDYNGIPVDGLTAIESFIIPFVF